MTERAPSLACASRDAVRSAGETPFDVVELLGIAVALVLAALAGSNPWLALALGILLIAPFIVRRRRRALRAGGERP